MTRLEGADEFRAWLKRAPREARKAFAGALFLEGEVVMQQSKDVFVPKDLGTLANSGFVEPPEMQGTKASVTLGYGGAAAAYALAVHEHPSGHSPPSWQGKTADQINWNVAGSGPKYLEKPVLEAQKNLDERIARRIKRRMETI